jgi:hypothetical protein
MKKLYAVLSAALLAGGLSPAAWALQPGCEEVPMMRGTITSLDPTSGRIELRTEKGPALAYFTPEALKNLKPGDPVALGLQPAIADKAAYERDMEQRFPNTTKPEEDIPTKSKQVGS